MESLQTIQTRLGAVKNVGKITKAMEVVAATKMRKAQEVAVASRPYALSALRMLEHVTRKMPLSTPLTTARPVKNTLVVLVSSDRGLAGSFNTQVFRVAEKILASEQAVSILPVGKKSIQFAEKKNITIPERFLGYGDIVTYDKVLPLANTILEGFLSGEWDKVMTVSMHFRTTLKQEPLVRQLLPTNYEKIQEIITEILPEHGRYSELRENGKKADENSEYIFEPSPSEVLTALIPYLVRLQVYHVILEANASEHSARMVAMKTASDNADELSESLKLLFNKARQAGITQEMIEIISTQNVL